MLTEPPFITGGNQMVSATNPPSPKGHVRDFNVDQIPMSQLLMNTTGDGDDHNQLNDPRLSGAIISDPRKIIAHSYNPSAISGSTSPHILRPHKQDSRQAQLINKSVLDDRRIETMSQFSNMQNPLAKSAYNVPKPPSPKAEKEILN